MIFVLMSIKLPRKNGWGKKNNLGKNLGQKYPKKSSFSQKPQKPKVQKIWIIQKAQFDNSAYVLRKK
jgi:hypothetical protein